MEEIAVAERDAYMKRLGDDYQFFLQELWKETKLYKVHPLDRAELDIAKWIQKGPKKRGVLAARGIGKTYIITAAFTCFRLYQDPERKILIVSKTGKAMREVMKCIRSWLDRVWFLNHLNPGRGDTKEQYFFDVPQAVERKQPSVKCVGITGMLEGNHVHTLIGDDLETKENCATPETRAKLALFCEEFVHIVYPDLTLVDDPDVVPSLYPPEQIMTGTVKPDFGSLWNSLEEQGYEFRTYPMVYPGPDDIKAARTIAPMLLMDLRKGRAQVGDPVFPKRFPAKEIEDRRKGKFDKATGQFKGGIRESEWLKEYMLYRDLSVTMPFKLKLQNLMVMHVDRETAPIHLTYGQHDEQGSTAIVDINSHGHGNDCYYRPMWIEKKRAPYTSTKAFVDPAGEGEDPLGLACIGHLGGFFHIKGAYEIDGGFDPATCNRVCELLRLHGVDELFCEHNFGGGMYATLLEPYLHKYFLRPGENPVYPDGWRCTIVNDKKVTHAYAIKEVRIVEILEFFTSQHRVIIDWDTAANPRFQSQFVNMRPVKDCLGFSPGMMDALAGCFLAWKQALSLDPEKQKDKLMVDDTEEEFIALRDFLHGKGRRQKPRANWLRTR